MQELLEWYVDNGRRMPWRETRNPYNVLISEFMLQQTQVSRVIPKYKTFIAKWPDFESLASAPRSAILQAWQGLGYNSRAARLHALAKIVVNIYDGNLPEDREKLLGLPGIGPYTAGAVMIFAFDCPARSMDVNIERILRRLFHAPEECPSHKELEDRQEALIHATEYPHDLHSAMMDLGSICRARNPSCGICPLRDRCRTRGEHPAETKSSQGRFEGSSRWWRGRILKNLLDRGMKEADLLGMIKKNPARDDEERFKKALGSLKKDGMIEVKGILRIKD